MKNKISVTICSLYEFDFENSDVLKTHLDNLYTTFVNSYTNNLNNLKRNNCNPFPEMDFAGYSVHFESDEDNRDLYIRIYRFETDKEYTERLKKEEMNKKRNALAEKALEKKKKLRETAEYKEYLRLRKLFE